MSLTSQLASKNSAVRKFFAEFENIEGAKECLSLLQSKLPIKASLLPVPASVSSYAYVGIAMDYLIRYIGHGNSLDFDNTIAGKALKRGCYGGFYEPFRLPPMIVSQYLSGLFRIAKKYLDGRDAADCKAVYAATALSVMDGVLRSGALPKLFTTFYFDDKIDSLSKDGSIIEDQVEVVTGLVLDAYIESLGGTLYIQDILSLIDIFLKSKNDINSDFFGAKLIVGNTALSNSRLVGGADFDCVFKCKEKMILTDIKTTIKPLNIGHLRQIISYALLYNEEKDDFIFSDIGIYHSRSGSFCFFPLDRAVKMMFPLISSTNEVRQKFVIFLEEIIEQERRVRTELLAMELAEKETLKQKQEDLKQKRRLARLARIEAIKSGEYELKKQKRALSKEKSRIEQEQAKKIRDNKKRRKKDKARRLARKLNQDAEASKKNNHCVPMVIYIS